MHQALARKYRPQTWAQVVGQEHVTVTLANAVKSGRLHHAYLFCGARGVGKTTVARILAKALNCTARREAEPCNQCASCLEITDGSSLDVQEIDGASNTSVEDVREIRERVKYLPSGDHYKVIIIDEVHMLSRAAFNALLKTLEEPPPHVLFVFATTEPHKIPATILSRCQRYDFQRVGIPHIVTTLRAIADQEGATVGDDVLHLLAFEAEGGLRDAESLLDQAIAFAGSTITIDHVRALLGLADRTTVWRLAEHVCARSTQAALTHLEQIFQGGGNLPRLAQELLGLFRHCWIVASCGALPNATELPVAEIEALPGLAARATVPEWQQWFALLFRGIDDIGRGHFPKLAFESLLLQMIQVGPMVPVDALLEKVEALMLRPSSGGLQEGPAATRQTSAPQPVIAVRSTPVRDAAVGTAPARSWEDFLAQVKKVRPQLASILEHSGNARFEGQQLLLEYPRASLYAEMLKEPDRTAQMREVLHDYAGPTCTWKLVESDGPSSTQARFDAQQRRLAQHRQFHEEALTHTMVREAHEILGAEIKEVKVLK